MSCSSNLNPDWKSMGKKGNRFIKEKYWVYRRLDNHWAVGSWAQLEAEREERDWDDHLGLVTKRHIWQVLGQHQHLNTGAVSVTIPPVDNFQSNCPNIFWPPSCHELHGVKLSTYLWCGFQGILYCYRFFFCFTQHFLFWRQKGCFWLACSGVHCILFNVI